VDAHPAFFVSERLLFVPAVLQGIEELGLPLHRRIRVHESEIVVHHRVERGHVAGERSCPTSLVGGENDLLGVVGRPRRNAESTDEATTSRVVILSDRRAPIDAGLADLAIPARFPPWPARECCRTCRWLRA
jgi:hypothetical protein